MTARKVCIEQGCSTLTSGTRCDEHRRSRDAARGTRQQRGYGAEHTALRRHYERRMSQGERFTCWRCGADLGPPWHLGHCDLDQNVYHGPEHEACNVAVSGRVGCPHPSHVDETPGVHPWGV